MPELPEVETVCRGLRPLVVGRMISRLDVREPRLRWPVVPELSAILPGQTIQSVSRRAKYILLELDLGVLLIHLGMSGVVRVVDAAAPIGRHDHIDLVFDDGHVLRMTDPRRFGAWLWWEGPIDEHPRLHHLGPEPLSDLFTGSYLYNVAQRRRVSIKNLVMDQTVVVGVGNIYASEALFRSGIDPSLTCNRIGVKRIQLLVGEIKAVLHEAIGQGGTTIRDFSDSAGKPGYFAQKLMVYGRTEQPCVRCGEPIRNRRIGGRSSFYCPKCQH